MLIERTELTSCLSWLEGRLTCSFEKLILDVELLQMQAAFLQPLVIDDDSMALAAIEEELKHE